MKNNYIVIKGIFEGVEFCGIKINNRIWNENTEGISYPEENCEEIKYDENQ